MEKARPDYVVWGALALSMVVRIQIASSDAGIYWPDEVYQSLEPAHRLVFGYGYVPWEFIDGARNWALPGLVAGLFFVCKLLRLTDPSQYLGLTRLAFSVAAVGCAYGVFRLAKACGANEWSAAVAGAAAALYPLGLYFGHRAMSENASALTVVLGLWLTVEDGSRIGGSRLRGAVGSSLLGASVLLRLQSGLFCVAALLWLLIRRQWRKAGEAFAVLCAWAFLFGLLDKFTWNGWFHSAFKYLQFNLVEGRAAAWGIAGFGYYFSVMWSSMPALSVLLAVGALLSVRKAPLVFGATVAFLAAHLFIPHKELRFLVPILPLLFALAAVGFSVLPTRVMQGALVALALVTSVSALRMGALTMGDIGAYPERPTTTAWDDYGPINRLLEIAGRRADVCGLVVPAHLAWVGGYSYFHKNVPLYMPNHPPQYRHYNYAIVPIQPGPTPVATDGPYELAKISDSCEPDPSFSWRLP